MASRHVLPYSIGRIVAVASRPLFLLAAARFAGEIPSALLATAFLVSSVALLFVAADPHKKLYENHFGVRTESDPTLITEYVSALKIAAWLGVMAVIIVVYLLEMSLLFAAVIGLYFLSEKLRDEVMRFLLFERHFSRWGWTMLIRTCLQAMLFALVLFLDSYASAVWMVLALTVGNFVVMSVSGLGKAESWSSGWTHWVSPWSWKMGLRHLWSSRGLWLIAVASASVGYSDRIVTLWSNPELIAGFTYAIMCMSAIPVLVDFFFISRKRREFLQRKMSLVESMLHPSFIGSTTLGVVLGLAAWAIGALLVSPELRIHSLAVVGIATLQFFAASTQIPREVSYWVHRPQRILVVELIFWACSITGAVVAAAMDLSLMWLLAFIAAAAAARFMFMLRLAMQPESVRLEVA